MPWPAGCRPYRRAVLGSSNVSANAWDSGTLENKLCASNSCIGQYMMIIRSVRTANDYLLTVEHLETSCLSLRYTKAMVDPAEDYAAQRSTAIETTSVQCQRLLKTLHLTYRIQSWPEHADSCMAPAPSACEPSLLEELRPYLNQRLAGVLLWLMQPPGVEHMHGFPQEVCPVRI